MYKEKKVGYEYNRYLQINLVYVPIEEWWWGRENIGSTISSTTNSSSIAASTAQVSPVNLGTVLRIGESDLKGRVLQFVSMNLAGGVSNNVG